MKKIFLSKAWADSFVFERHATVACHIVQDVVSYVSFSVLVYRHLEGLKFLSKFLVASDLDQSWAQGGLSFRGGPYIILPIFQVMPTNLAAVSALSDDEPSDKPMT